MQSMAKFSTAELKAFSKCAQLSMIMNGDLTDSAMKQAKRIIRKDGDINFQIPSNGGNEVVGSTLLHIAWNSVSSEITEDLLNLGADFTLKNKDENTALHGAFRMCFLSNKLSKYQEESITNLILSAHIKFGNFANPCNNDGFFHFHIACMANHVKAVQFFLENGVHINQAVNKEARTYPGFTPLHCAVKSYSIETVEILLKNGADRDIINGYGMTPLHQLINRRIKLLESMIRDTRMEKTRTLEEEVEKIDQMIFKFLGNNFLDHVDIVDSSGLSSLHIACTMQDSCRVESLLGQVQNIDHCISPDSPMWPGYTALHFAAHCNVDAMKILHSRGANIDFKNAKGLTPFDICLKMGHVESVHAALSLKPEWANILFSDDKTRLVNFISAMRDTTQLSNFICNCLDDINMTLPNNSPLWPGCTPLHLAVIIFHKYIEHSDYHYTLEKESVLEQIEELLNNGADVTRIDANGRSPLHHAFQQEKLKVSKLLRTHHQSSANPVDNDNLSHLHIACAEYDESLVEKILSSSNIDVNIPYKGEKDVQKIKTGWMPLNCVSYNGKIKQMLLQHGAKDFSTKKDRCDTNTLHYACEKSDKGTVQRLLELGADVDFALNDGRTPLHIAADKNSLEVVELLLQRGADLVAKDKNGDIPLYHIFSSTKDVSQLMISVLKQDDELQKRMEKETGMTMLHIACYMLDVDEVRSQLDRGVNADARVHEDSGLWSECTALLMLMIKVIKGLSKEEILSDVGVITELLLEKGADVTLWDEDYEKTLVHISYDCTDKDWVSRTKCLLKYQRDFQVNPVDCSGVSLFHIAVMLNDVETVEKFLNNGVNVDQPTAYFADTDNGFTPLHMAIGNAKTEDGRRIVDLLLEHGADVNLEDASGNSALHKTIEYFKSGPLRLSVMEKLLIHGANINSEDAYGVTPYESLLHRGNPSAEDIRFFVKHGCRVNASNPADDCSYLGVILGNKDKELRDSLFEESMKALDVGTVNELGRTLMHSVVAVTEPAISSKDYVELLDSFNRFGFDIDDQDHAGQTALHLAAIFGNDKAITALLNMGADVEIVDAKGKTALSYAVEPCTKCENDSRYEHHHEKAVEALVMQVLKLFSSVAASCLNCDNLAGAFKILNWHWNGSWEDHEEVLEPPYGFYSEMSMAEKLIIKPVSLSVHDFLGLNFVSENNALIKYSLMSESNRRIIDRAFDSVDLYFEELLPILKLQHRKAVMRFQLLQAASSLNSLIRFPLPDLCTQKILRYLKNADLKRLVAAMNLEN